MSPEPAYTLARQFNSPPEQVFEAWTRAALLAEWWGPHEFTNPVCEFEARPGGGIRIDMKGPDGVVYPMTGAVEEIEAPGKLVFSSVALDETGRALFKVRTAVSIVEENGRSSLEIKAWITQKASSAADAHLAGMRAGWTQSLERLDALLRQGREGREIV